MATAKKNLAPVEETKEVATTKRSDLQMAAAQTAGHQDVVASDVIIPRLLLMQAISPLVTSRKAQIGDLIRSTTGEKLGDPDKPLDLVILAMTNSWIDYERVPGDNQPKFRGMYPRGVITRDTKGNPIESNTNLPWKFVGPNKEDMFRRQAVIVYALVPSDIAAYEKELDRAVAAGEVPDLSKGVSPVVLTFQSTSFKYGGKQIATFFNNVKKTNVEMKGRMTVAPFDYVMTLTCREEKKGTAAWYVFDFKGAPKSLSKVYVDKAECEAIKEKAAFWTQALSSGGVKIDDSAEIDDEDTSISGGSSASEMEV